MTWAFRRREEPDGGGPKHQGIDTGREFEDLLREAEALLVAVRRAARRKLVLRCLQAALVVLPPLLLLAVGEWRADDEGRADGGWRLAALAALAGAVALGAVAEAYAVRPLIRTLDRRLAELTQLVDMLREVLVHLSKQERWPAHRVRDARHRLARFSIEERGGLL